MSTLDQGLMYGLEASATTRIISGGVGGIDTDLPNEMGVETHDVDVYHRATSSTVVEFPH